MAWISAWRSGVALCTGRLGKNPTGNEGDEKQAARRWQVAEELCANFLIWPAIRLWRIAGLMEFKRLLTFERSASGLLTEADVMELEIALILIQRLAR